MLDHGHNVIGLDDTPLLQPPIQNIDVDVLGLRNRFCDTKISNIDVLLEFLLGLLRIVAGLFSV